MGPRPTPPRVLDRLRTRSPIFRRVAMNSRGVQTLSPRANCLINAGVSKKYYTTPSKSESISSRSQRSGNITITTKTPTGCCTPTSKNSRNTTVRPTRTNVAVNLTPRKSSAPTKLIRSINGSLESLPDTVTVRRKISTPAKSICPFSAVSHRNTPNPKPTSIKTNKRASPICTNSPGVPPKKFSAPSKLGSDTPGIQKISKDHSNSGPPLSAAGGFTSTEASKPLKKTPGAEAPQQKYLAPVKEEKKTKIKSKKMTSAPVAPPEVHASFPSDYPQGPMTSQKGPVAAEEATEKNNLEKMVSDLIKNSESKKQEIAALKIEINRLKEVIREKQSSNSSDGGKDDVSKSSAECSRTSKEGSYSSAHLDAGDEDEISRLEAIVDSLSAENRFLREHLQHLGVTLDSSPLSDQQKEMILSRVSSAFSQSGGCAENLSSGVGERDWDNKSSSSLSEISVACLQGRIQQMEETHYSTHEELQATLQELEDLREQMSECRMEIQTLQEEKQVILESLTQQTEKLNEARGYNDTLKLMLIQQSENSHDMSQCERTQRLMELLKSVQEDKELMYIKQDEIEEQMRASKHAEEHFHREAQLIRDRMKLLESIVESAMNDKKIAENELQEVLESVKSKENELSRVSAALTSAKDKITELEAAVLSGEKSELADVLERVRGEKESAEKEVVSVQRKVNQLVCENDRLKDQVAVLKENLLVTRNNAKSNLDDVQWHRTQLDERRRELEMEITSLKASLTEAQMTCQHHLEDKRELKTTISDLQKKLTEASERVADAERALSDERAAFAKQIAEWDQFQKDLLTSVRVANDFKTEALKSLEKTEYENCLLKERMKQMDVELDRTRAASKFPSPTNSLASINNFNGSNTVVGSSSSERRMYKGVVSNGDAILSDRRANPRPLSRGDSRVKSLIESIECATKHAKAGSRSSSTSSLASSGSENNNMKSQLRRAETESMLRNLPSTLSSISPLKESSYSNGITSSPSPLRALNVNTYTDSLSGQYSTPTTNGKTNSSSTNLPDTVKMSQLSNEKMANKFGSGSLGVVSIDNNKPMSILSNKIEPIRRSNFNSMSMGDKKDPLATLAQSGGSKRNALLKWCQNKTLGYRGVDITNFSSSWNDGLAFCALLATYLPDKFDYTSLSLTEKRKNFEIAFAAAESVGISTILDVNELLTLERPSWQSIFNYVTSIYSHFET